MKTIALTVGTPSQTLETIVTGRAGRESLRTITAISTICIDTCMGKNLPLTIVLEDTCLFIQSEYMNLLYYTKRDSGHSIADPRD